MFPLLELEEEIPVDSHTFFSESDEDKTLIMILGLEGSGKELYTAELAKTFDFGHLSIKEIVDVAATKTAHPYYTLVAELEGKGDPIPHEVLCSLLLNEMRAQPLSRFVIDDFPTDISHLFGLNDFVLPHIKLDLLVFLECPKDFCLDRCLGDHEQIPMEFRKNIIENINKAKLNMEPIVEFYKDRELLIEADATRDFKIVFEDIATRIVNILEPLSDSEDTISITDFLNSFEDLE